MDQMNMPPCPMCQSCGMPMCEDKDKGTNADGSLSEENCVYCWKDGAYTNPDITVKEMKDLCVKGICQMKGMPEEEAKKMVDEYIPKLKRWQK